MNVFQSNCSIAVNYMLFIWEYLYKKGKKAIKNEITFRLEIQRAEIDQLRCFCCGLTGFFHFWDLEALRCHGFELFLSGMFWSARFFESRSLILICVSISWNQTCWKTLHTVEPSRTRLKYLKSYFVSRK